MWLASGGGDENVNKGATSVFLRPRVFSMHGPPPKLKQLFVFVLSHSSTWCGWQVWEATKMLTINIHGAVTWSRGSYKESYPAGVVEDVEFFKFIRKKSTTCVTVKI